MYPVQCTKCGKQLSAMDYTCQPCFEERIKGKELFFYSSMTIYFLCLGASFWIPFISLGNSIPQEYALLFILGFGIVIASVGYTVNKIVFGILYPKVFDIIDQLNEHANSPQG